MRNLSEDELHIASREDQKPNEEMKIINYAIQMMANIQEIIRNIKDLT
jgi:hypothetical protein